MFEREKIQEWLRCSHLAVVNLSKIEYFIWWFEFFISANCFAHEK